MRTVYKFELPDFSTNILLPDNFVIAHFGFQNSKMMLWIEVNTKRDFKNYSFQIFGTGQPIPEGYTFARTLIDGAFVWHLYYL
jgi:hypothetical protein